MTLEQYKEIMKLKKEKERVSELTYAKLGGKLGLRPSTIVNAARKGIKRYDYQIWKDEQKVTQSETLREQEQPR